MQKADNFTIYYSGGKKCWIKLLFLGKIADPILRVPGRHTGKRLNLSMSNPMKNS
jgi:hypothetical protein